MKSIKTILFGLIALGACATAANAQTTVRIYINGSTAFRSSAVAAIKQLFVSGTEYGEVYAGAAASSAPYDSGQDAAIYSGIAATSADSVNTNPTLIVKTSWLGSESGIQAVADAQGTTTANFLADNPSTNSNNGSTTVSIPALGGTTSGSTIDDPTVINSNGTIGNSNGAYEAKTPDACFADTFQATSQYNTNASITYVGGAVHTFNALTGATNSDPYTKGLGSHAGIVAVVPFMFESTNDSALTNVTSDTAKHLYTSGFLPRAYFSGLTSDTNVRVYPIGRNPDSGTRLSVSAIIGAGALSQLTQYEPFDNTGAVVTTTAQSVATVELWPLDTVNQISVAAGNSGFDSGSYLANATGASTSSMKFQVFAAGSYHVSGPTGGDLLAYVGASGSPAGKALTYNGFTPSTQNVANGTYGLWTYEHLYYGSTISAGSDGQSILNYLATEASTLAGTTVGSSVAGSLSLDAMNVYRGTSSDYDAQQIVPLYSGF